MPSKWHEPGGNPEVEFFETPPKPETPPRPRPAWLKSTWFRLLVLVVFAAIPAAIALPNAGAWAVLFLAGAGLAVVLFGDELYDLSAESRGRMYEGGENLERTDYTRIKGMIAGVTLWILSLVMAFIAHAGSK